MKEYVVAIVGATGAVGMKMTQLLEESSLVMKEMRLLSSARSAGKVVHFRGEEVTILEAKPAIFRGVDIALFSAGGDVSRALVPEAIKHGAICIDNTSAFRMDEGVPLVVPEVNEQALFAHKGLIANPNCSTIQMVTALAPLRAAFGMKRIIVSTYQAVSGAGAAAIDELKKQSTTIINEKEVESAVFPYPIAFNCIPQIDSFHESGYTLEELKMMNETKKIMELPDLKVAATCVRLPVITGHSESVYVEFEQEGATVTDVQRLLRVAPGVTLQDDPSTLEYPMPADCVDKKDVFVGRIRQDVDELKGFHLWIVSDNLVKGAAWNSVQIAERLVALKII